MNESNNTIPPQESLQGAREQPLVWEALRKYWTTALATTTLVFIASIFFTLGQTRIYEARATLMFDPTPPRPLGSRVESVVDMGAGSFWTNKEYYETQYRIIQSRRIALLVVKELGLHRDHAFLQNLPAGQAPSTSDTETTPENAAEILRSRIEVVPIRDSRLTSVNLRDANPERAQRVLRVLVDTYVNRNLDSALESTGAATDWLRGQLDSLKRDLEQSELALHDYRRKNDILSVTFDDKSGMLAEEMKQISAQLTQTRTALQEASARKAVLASVPADDPTAIESRELLDSPLLNTLRSQYEEAVRSHATLIGSGKGENHPEVLAAINRVERAKRAILKEIRNIQRAVDRDVMVLSRQAGGLQQMLDEAKKEAHDHNLLEIEYNRLRRQKDNTEKLYSLILERTKETDLTQMLRINNISIVDEPLKPAVPIRPRIPLNLALGLFLGCLMGVSSVVVRTLMDRTLKVPDEVESELGLVCLGLLPKQENVPRSANRGKRGRRGRRAHEPDVKPELAVHREPYSSVAEAARTIRTNLMFMSPDRPYHTLLITSSVPFEGKTTVACHVAIAMAQAGQRVALVDCDLRRPRVHRVFSKTNREGVTTGLFNDSFADIAQETEVPNLMVVPAGPIPPHSAELLHTEKFARLLAHLRASFDRVIIDSSPIAAVTDPTILSTLVDGTILVVRANKTRKDLARHALRALRAVGGEVPGVILNGVDFSRTEYKYSYEYYRRDDYAPLDVLDSPLSNDHDDIGNVDAHT